MEAKDTVIDVIEYGTGKTIPMNAQEAINLSFKAGIKEVVEWVKENRETPIGEDQYGYYIWGSKLQAKLKEWGIT